MARAMMDIGLSAVMSSGVPTSGSSGTGAMYSFSSSTYYPGVGLINYSGGTSLTMTKNGATTVYTLPSSYIAI